MNRFSEEDILRSAASLIGVVGLSALLFSLGTTFGLWASGLLLTVVGGGFAVVLWRRRFEAQELAREAAKSRVAVPDDEPGQQY